jgi:hypothetical protein
MSKPSLTVITITKNEAPTIQRCLKSTSFAREQIVVDSASEDHTQKLAEQLGAKVLINPWSGYGPQKNYGANHALNDWVLFIDADEEVTPALAKEITQILSNPTRNFYWLKIITVFLGKPLHHLYGHNLRLFRKNQGHWTNTGVHEQVATLDGLVVQLNSEYSQILAEPLLHHSHPTISSYLQKMHHYTTLDAKEMATTNQHRSGRPVKPTWWLPTWLAVRQFLKLAFYRRGILDSWQGITWCALSGYYEYKMAQKYLNLVK